jgi:HEAT repeat protein
MLRRLSLLAFAALAAPAIYAAPPAEKISPDDDKLLKGAKLAAEGPALLDYFKKRTLTAQNRDKIDELIRKLGDDSFKVREKAGDDLRAFGAVALPQLRRALGDPDEEVRERAREGIAAVEEKANADLSAAAARVLRTRAPAETVKVLLEYAPDAENDAVAEEVLTTLAVVGVKENKVDALLVEALKDKHPARRAAAALAVGRSGTAEQRKKVQALLSDADVRVRFRAAQGLLAARDRAGIPALIALLAEAPPELAARAEELLSCATAGRGPRSIISDNTQQNRAARAAWEQWWKNNAKLDLAHADVDLPPYNPTLRARETVRQFIVAATAADNDKLNKLIDTPFIVLGDQALTKREQVQPYAANYVQNFLNRGLQPAGSPMATTTLEEYLKTATPRDKPLLEKLPKKDVRVILMQPVQFGPRGDYVPAPGEAPVFVRVSGDQPVVIGLGFGFDRRIIDR